MDEEQIIKANNTFSIDLYTKLKEPEKNLFFSPFSIFMALSIIYAGARGLTENQMKENLHIILDQNRFHKEFKKLIRILYSDRGSELHIANLLCIQKGYELLERFFWIIDDIYSGAIWELNFKADTDPCTKINAWVAEQTRGKIKNIINAIDENMGLILVNAIYFKGTWHKPFKEEDTEDESFTLISGEEVLVPMMHKTDNNRFLEDNSFQILEMHYKRIRIFGILEQISMVIFLPKEKNGLDELEEYITIEKIINYLTRLEKLSEQKIKVIIPRFKIETRYELSKTLSELGFTDAFTNRADFSGIAKDSPGPVSKVIHKTFVDVNEKGTEAAAATALTMLGASLGPRQEPPEFRADHPFLYLLIDSQTRTILFMGRLMNPKV